MNKALNTTAASDGAASTGARGGVAPVGGHAGSAARGAAAHDGLTRNGERCPNCREPMHRHVFETRLRLRGEVDVCVDCRVIWFDAGEAVQLGPRSVIDIFTLIFRHQEAFRRPLSKRLGCPRCDSPLAFTRDIGRHGRFSYYRCGEGHGRLTPFTEFLRERRFVRELAPAEVAQVRAEIRQVRCSGCGAPVDLASGSACSFCGAPVAILDAAAVETALHQLTREMQAMDTERARIDALLSARAPDIATQCLSLARVDVAKAARTDLIDAGVHAVGELLSGIGLRL